MTASVQSSSSSALSSATAATPLLTRPQADICIKVLEWEKAVNAALKEAYGHLKHLVYCDGLSGRYISIFTDLGINEPAAPPPKQVQTIKELFKKVFDTQILLLEKASKLEKYLKGKHSWQQKQEEIDKVKNLINLYVNQVATVAEDLKAYFSKVKTFSIHQCANFPPKWLENIQNETLLLNCGLDFIDSASQGVPHPIAEVDRLITAIYLRNFHYNLTQSPDLEDPSKDSNFAAAILKFDLNNGVMKSISNQRALFAASRNSLKWKKEIFKKIAKVFAECNVAEILSKHNEIAEKIKKLKTQIQLDDPFWNDNFFWKRTVRTAISQCELNLKKCREDIEKEQKDNESRLAKVESDYKQLKQEKQIVRGPSLAAIERLKFSKRETKTTWDTFIHEAITSLEKGTALLDPPPPPSLTRPPSTATNAANPITAFAATTAAAATKSVDSPKKGQKRKPEEELSKEVEVKKILSTKDKESSASK